MSSVNSYLPNKDADLAAWLDNFNTVAAANKAVLKLTDADISPSTDATANFEAGLASVAARHAAAKLATMNKDAARTTSVSIARALVKHVQATPNVPATLKAQLRINVGGTRPKPLPLFAPANALASIEAGGIIQLTWDVNGNAPGAIYTIETAPGSTNTWTVINSQTAARFLDTEAALGTVTQYRVKAQRNTRVSAYSNIAVVSAK